MGRERISAHKENWRKFGKKEKGLPRQAERATRREGLGGPGQRGQRRRRARGATPARTRRGERKRAANSWKNPEIRKIYCSRWAGLRNSDGPGKDFGPPGKSAKIREKRKGPAETGRKSDAEGRAGRARPARPAAQTRPRRDASTHTARRAQAGG